MYCLLEKKMKKKKFVRVIALFALIWSILFAADFVRVCHFKKPVFCILVNGYDDGGSGTYVGLGYTVEIEGNFVTEDEQERGVTSYDMKLFGIIRVLAGIRC